ncbi:MAG: zinc metallopeptidase [Clostridia bacterium]|nr:zinc metallopeptidase [Clostridia bacterium]
MDIVLYLLAIAALIFSVWAQIKVNTTFNRYSRSMTQCGKSAAEVARMILNSAGIADVRIERVGGSLTDHYDPRSNTLRLSDSVYSSSSAAAIGVAAHEAGHAIQHAKGYIPIKIRMALVPAVSFASRFTWVIIIVGFLMLALDSLIGYYVALLGIGLFAVATLFELVTLPCEFNASRRAMEALSASGWYSRQELRGSRKVLTAAALTYVAALAVSLIQLLRLVLSLNRRRR